MKRLGKYLTALLLPAGTFLPGSAQAMDIREFDRMADQDQAAYIGDLIVGAEKVLTDQGKPDLAAKVKRLFTTRYQGDADTIGMVEFERNLALLRVNDARHAEKNPNDPRLEVEDAMFGTLERNGIELPDSFYSVAKNFKPRHPAR
jgi:hypothetical protein